MPVIRFRYARPDQRGFSFCEATIKSRKQFAARNSHNGDGRTPSEQFYLTTELSNVVGTSHIFVRKILRPHITDFDSQITVICNGSVSRPLFVHSSLGICCISHHLQHSWTAARMAFLWPVPFGHIVLFWPSAFSPWSKLRVIIWSMLRFRTTLHIPFANVFPSFELLLHKCPLHAHF